MATWHTSTRPQTIELDMNIRWVRLQIQRVTAGDASDYDGQVEYIAVFKRNGKAHRLHEHSRFVRENSRWFYINGNIR